MFSGADNLIEDSLVAVAPPPLRQPWADFPVSHPAHHGTSCCETARDWVAAMDFAQLGGSSMTSGPRWLRERYEWGPSPWPIHWCELVGRKTIDCGAHSALAHEAFEARGLIAFRTQFIQRYSSDAVEQWRLKWRSADISDHWLGTGVIYHEGNAILLATGELKLWDSSAGWWIGPGSVTGYGSLAAVRLLCDAPRERSVHSWGDHPIVLGEWAYFGEGEMLDSRKDPVSSFSTVTPACGAIEDRCF
jgi:hypothetical protein